MGTLTPIEQVEQLPSRGKLTPIDDPVHIPTQGVGGQQSVYFGSEGQIKSLDENLGSFFASQNNNPFDAPNDFDPDGVSIAEELAAGTEAQAAYIGYIANAFDLVSDQDAAGFISDRLKALKYVQANQPENVKKFNNEFKSAQGFFGKTSAILKNLDVMGRTTVTQSPNSIIPILTTLGGAASGVSGGVVGSAIGGAIGGFSGTAIVEFGVEMDQIASELGYDTSKPDELLKFLEDDQAQDAAKARAAKKGVTVGVVDALFQVVGGRFLRSAKPTVAGKTSGAAKDVGIQTAGEFTGEALSQKIARGEVDLDDAVLEALTAAPTSVAQTIIGATIPSTQKAKIKEIETKIQQTNQRLEQTQADTTISDDQKSKVTADLEKIKTNLEKSLNTEIKTAEKQIEKSQAEKYVAELNIQNGDSIQSVELNIGDTTTTLNPSQEVSDITGNIKYAPVVSEQEKVSEKLEKVGSDKVYSLPQADNYEIQLQEIKQDLGIASNPVVENGNQTNPDFAKELNSKLRAKGFDYVSVIGADGAVQSLSPTISKTSKAQELGEFISQPNKNRLSDSVQKNIKDFNRSMAAAFEPLSTQLRNISENLLARLRKYEFNLKKQILEDEKKILPFLQKYNKLSKNDMAALDYAMKNGDQELLQALAEKNDMVNEFQSLREALDGLYQRAEEVGMDIGYIENYFPRHVQDPEGLLNYFRETEAWGDIEAALEQKRLELGMEALTDETKAHLINTLLRGYKTQQVALSKPGALKERNIDRINADINKFYNTTDQAIIRYISIVNDAVESRKFFGKDGGTETDNILDSIGGFVLRELERGNIDVTDQKKLTELLQARFQRGKMGAVVRTYKNLSYIDTMGSVVSAITQLGDLAFSMHYNGVYGTLKALVPAALDKSKVKRVDLGIDKIAQEFDSSSTSGKAVDAVFKTVGLDRMDRLGKETFINSSFNKYKNLARKNPEQLTQQLRVIFDDDAARVAQEFKDGLITDDTKLVLFNDLMDIQPISLSEMPKAYLQSGNARLLYMLKSFTIKQIDIYRREVITKGFAAGKPVTGVKNLTSLLAFFVVMNAGADYLKNLLLNRDAEIEDYVVDNILRAFFISKFQIYTAEREGVGTAIGKTILPPFKLVDSLWKDMNKAIKDGEVDVNNLETIASVPIVGKLYYWWFGAGAEREQKKKDKTNF